MSIMFIARYRYSNPSSFTSVLNRVVNQIEEQMLYLRLVIDYLIISLNPCRTCVQGTILRRHLTLRDLSYA